MKKIKVLRVLVGLLFSQFCFSQISFSAEKREAIEKAEVLRGHLSLEKYAELMLFVSARKNNVEGVREALLLGVDVNLKRGSETALSLAENCKNKKVIKFLREAGAIDFESESSESESESSESSELESESGSCFDCLNCLFHFFL